MNEYIKSDLYRLYGNCSFSTFCLAWRRHPSFRFLVAFRLAKSGGGTTLYW